MSRGRKHLSLVVDEVLDQANAAAQRRQDESNAIKVAAAQPRTDLARGLRGLADTLRGDHDDLTYSDIARVS